MVTEVLVKVRLGQFSEILKSKSRALTFGPQYGQQETETEERNVIRKE